MKNYCCNHGIIYLRFIISTTIYLDLNLPIFGQLYDVNVSLSASDYNITDDRRSEISNYMFMFFKECENFQNFNRKLDDNKDYNSVKHSNNIAPFAKN